MTTPSTPAGPLSLRLRRTATAPQPLLPEEEPGFVLSLHNDAGAPVQALDLNGNMSTPVLTTLGRAGAPIEELDRESAMRRAGIDPGHKQPPPPKLVEVVAHGERSRPLLLWRLTEPYAPGMYQARASHQPREDAEPIISNTVPFEIVAAQVHASALDYDWVNRQATVHAWLASAQGVAPWRLLLRTSSPKGPAVLASGAIAAGEFPAGARVAVSAAAHDTLADGQGWICVVHDGQAWAVPHSFGTPGAAQAFAVTGVRDAQPVAGFPRFSDGALVLLAGASPASDPPSGVLAGVAVSNGRSPAAAWTLPLGGVPRLIAVSPRDRGAITIAYVTDDGRASNLHRLRMNAAGKVTEPDNVVRRSAHRALALRHVSSVEAPAAFVLFESDRDRPDQVGYVRVPVDGPPHEFATHPVKGWPDAPVAEFDADQDGQGVLRLAVLTGDGTLYAGRLDRGLTKLNDGHTDRLSHVCSVGGGAPAVVAFHADGRLFFNGGAPHH